MGRNLHGGTDFAAPDGDYPCFVVLTKTGGVWTYNASASKTAAQMASTPPREMPVTVT